jgi:hypothetical protein
MTRRRKNQAKTKQEKTGKIRQENKTDNQDGIARKDCGQSTVS